jgi:hypothetical protein
VTTQVAPPKAATGRATYGAPANRGQNKGRLPKTAGNTRLGRTITTASGAVVASPHVHGRPRPEPAEDAPSRFNAKPGTPIATSIPPSPGITARRFNEATVLVTYDVFSSDPRCRPTNLELTLDVNDDTLPGSSTVAQVRHARGTLTIDVPPYLANADVLRAIARSAEGYPSEAASVLIR